MNGTIARILHDKGFGFIDGEDGDEYFFHKSRLVDPSQFDQILASQRVEFTTDTGPKGKRAKDIELV